MVAVEAPRLRQRDITVHLPSAAILASRTVPLVKPDLPNLDEVADGFRDILSTGRLSNLGPYATRFEEPVGRKLGVHALTISSCSLGLVLSFQALGLRPGQNVVVPSSAFVGTAQAVLYDCGVPVFAEIDPDFTISPGDLAALLTADREIATVRPVHTYGLPTTVGEIERVVDEAASWVVGSRSSTTPPTRSAQPSDHGWSARSATPKPSPSR